MVHYFNFDGAVGWIGDLAIKRVDALTFILLPGV